MKLLLDTSVLIDVLRHRNQRREFVAELVRAGHIISTSMLNVAEVYAGMRPSEEPDAEELFASLHLHELSGRSARLAGEMKNGWSKKGRTLTLADAIIAAVAIEQGCQLLTDNRKDFPMPELQLYALP
jgi:predicted nucleic acid-binding protein